MGQTSVINQLPKRKEGHTVGPAIKDVPESTIAEQPPSQIPEKDQKTKKHIMKVKIW